MLEFFSPQHYYNWIFIFLITIFLTRFTQKQIMQIVQTYANLDNHGAYAVYKILSLNVQNLCFQTFQILKVN